MIGLVLSSRPIRIIYRVIAPKYHLFLSDANVSAFN
jgi:hypothetical protein